MKNTLKKGFAIILSSMIMMCLLPAAHANAAEFSTGTINGNVYENDFFNIKLELPEGYTFVDEETLAQINEISINLLRNNAAAVKSIEKGQVITFALAKDENGYNTINITISNLGDDTVTDKDVAIASIDELAAFLVENGYVVDSIDAIEKTVAGESRVEISVEAAADGYKFFEQIIPIVKDGYNMNVTYANYFLDEIDTLLNSLQKIN